MVESFIHLPTRFFRLFLGVNGAVAACVALIQTNDNSMPMVF